MKSTPYYCRQYDWPFKIIYNEYHSKHHSKGDEFEKLLTVRGSEIIVQAMWRMQILGELHSELQVHTYNDPTNWEYYYEVLYQIDSMVQFEGKGKVMYAESEVERLIQAHYQEAWMDDC